MHILVREVGHQMSSSSRDSAREPVLLPSSGDVAGYQARGWYLSEKLLSDADVHQLAAASNDFYRKLSEQPNLTSRHGTGWMPGDGDIHRNNDYIHIFSQEIAAVLRKPVIGQVAAALAEAYAIRIFQSTLIYKPPRADDLTSVVPWHFDKYYWPTCSSDKLLTAFIPFHDCTVEMGTLTMVDGSHLWVTREIDDKHPDDSVARQELLESLARANGVALRFTPVTIPAGHMTFHHCLLFHGSSVNRCDTARRSISLHLQDDGNKYQDPSEYPVGRQGPYKHDEIVRRDDAGRPDYSDPLYCPQIWKAWE